jgi:cyclopropane fatty-acyl-phospholipid synthase-like methyltransferase
MQQSRDDYVNHYQAHYLRLGLTGAGTLEHEKKLSQWEGQGWNKEMSVLDYGCGVGSMAKVCDYDKYVGVDIAAEAIRLAKEQNPKHSFKVMQIGKVKLPKKVDFCVAASVFTHTRYDDVPDSLADLKVNLKKTGFGIIDILPSTFKVESEHVRFWPVPAFMLELEKAGFKGTPIETIHWNNGYTHDYIRIEHL